MNINEDTSAEAKGAVPEEYEADTEECDGQLTLFPALSISTNGFDEAEAYTDSDGEQNGGAVCDGTEIVPPDELFSVRKDAVPQEVAAEESGEDGTPEISEEEISDGEDGEKEEEPQQCEISREEPAVREKPKKNTEDMTSYDPKKPRRIDGRFDFIELCIFTLLAVMIVTAFFFRHSIVDGQSMEGTLHNGEHLIVSDLFYTAQRGDIIVCEDYTTAIPKPIVKRVIAVGGDTVKITRDGRVYVNGELLDESGYVYIDDPSYEYSPLELTVPENELFVMGDHRNRSTDSRYIGTISEDSVLGKVLLRFYPFNKFGIID